MPKRHRRVPVPDNWESSILNVTIDPVGGQSLYEALAANKKERERLLSRARTHLVTSPLTPLVADAVAVEFGLPEGGDLVLDDAGLLILDIPPKTEGRRRRWRTRLPSLPEYRQMAEDRGIDISDLGRQKKLIQERLDAFDTDKTPTTDPELEPAPTPQPRKKRVKTAPAVTPPTVVDTEPQGDKAKLLDDGGAPGVGDLHLFEEEPPETTPKKAGKKSRLQVVAEGSEDIDLSAILAEPDAPTE